MYRLKFNISEKAADCEKYFWFQGVRGEEMEFFIDLQNVETLNGVNDIKHKLNISDLGAGEHEMKIVVKAHMNLDSGIINKVSLIINS
jgi:hypothetical protein